MNPDAETGGATLLEIGGGVLSLQPQALGSDPTVGVPARSWSVPTGPRGVAVPTTSQTHTQ